MVGDKNGGSGKLEIIKRHMPADVAAIKFIQFLISVGEWGD
jgi:hypothetical protein